MAVAGAFLLDAETRLNPSLAASYFGAASRARVLGPLPARRTVAGSAASRSPLAELDPEIGCLPSGRRSAP